MLSPGKVFLWCVIFWVLQSCGLGVSPPQTPSTSDEVEISQESRRLLDKCTSTDSHDHAACREVEFKCSIIANEDTKKPKYTAAENAPDCEAGLSAKTSGQFRWVIRFDPKKEETFNRQFRYVVRNQDDLPAFIEFPNRSNSNELRFDVDLSNTADKCDGGEHHGKPRQDEGSTSSRCAVEKSKSHTDWIAEHKQGVIEVDVQDVTYCYTQNRKNRGVSSNQVDCSNTTSGQFRTKSFTINYNLDCERDNWLNGVYKSAVIAASGLLNNLIRSDVLNGNRINDRVFGCKS